MASIVRRKKWREGKRERWRNRAGKQGVGHNKRFDKPPEATERCIDRLTIHAMYIKQCKYICYVICKTEKTDQNPSHVTQNFECDRDGR